MLQCFHFIVEPAKHIAAKLKESRGRTEKENKEPLEEEQLFVVELARDLGRVCRNAEALEHIWNLEDTWPRPLCRAFILEWGSMLESKKRPMQTDGWPEKAGQENEDQPEEGRGEQDLDKAKAALLTWVKDLRAQPEQSVWPGEPVSQALDDLRSAWKWSRTPNLLASMELVMMTLLSRGLDKDGIPQKWLVWKQRTQNIAATPYIPHSVWNWISDAAVDVTLDLDTANPDLLISRDEKRMRCGFERRDVPNRHERFDGWWCAAAASGFSSGRHYWEAEVGERDWRVGVAEESAPRKGFKSLNADGGYLTLRLERGAELKALTVPFTALPSRLVPRRVGVHLDFPRGQLSFYDAEARAHIYTYNRSFAENKLYYPLFGTVEIGRDLVIRSPGNKPRCLCPASCLWA